MREDVAQKGLRLRRLIPGVNDMATTRPDLAADLVGTDPTTVFAQTNRTLLWRCPNHDEPYPSTGSNRARGQGCGFCHRLRLLPGFNDMATTHPALARELVGTDPTTVIAGSARVMLWSCPNHDEPYPASGNSRVSGHGCGYCHGLRVLPGYNDMATTRPDLARQVVGIDPVTVFAGTLRTLTWHCPNHADTYQATGAARVRGTGCSYCANQKVLPGFNDMATTRPDMAACLVGTDPRTVIAGTPKVLLWKCPNHDQPYPAKGSQKARGQGCGYCHSLRVLPGYNDMATTRPDLASELVGTDPTTVIAGTRTVLMWRCPNHVEPYPLTGSLRAKGIGCSYCANQRILPGLNDMATTHPSLAAELVGTDPTTVFAGTERILLWRCPNHPEPYPARGFNRLKDRSCGYCSNRRLLPGFNDMAITHPDLAAEVADCDPSTVIASSPRKHLWRCHACGHQWSAPASMRARGTGCPACADYGFDPEAPAWVYLMERHGEQQIGITGSLPRRTGHHARSGWVLVETIGPMRGSLAYEKELQIKQWLRQKVGTLAGTTESWSTASLEVRSLGELFDLAEGKRATPALLATDAERNDQRRNAPAALIESMSVAVS